MGSTTGSSQAFAASGGWSKILDTVDASDGDDSMYSDQVVNSAAAVANTGTCASGTAYSAAIFSYKAVTAITITPTSFAFGSVTAGGASTPTTFTVKNGGNHDCGTEYRQPQYHVCPDEYLHDLVGPGRHLHHQRHL